MLFFIDVKDTEGDITQAAILEVHRRVPSAVVALVGAANTDVGYSGAKMRLPVMEREDLARFCNGMRAPRPRAAHFVDVDALLAGDAVWWQTVRGRKTFSALPPLNPPKIAQAVTIRTPVQTERIDGFTLVPGPEGIGFVAVYFNALGYRRLFENFCNFLERFAWLGDRLLVVECAFHDQPYVLTNKAKNIIQVRSSTVLWQKEAMINLGTTELRAAGFEFVGWLDGDVCIDTEGEQWLQMCREALRTHSLVQVFESLRHNYDDDVLVGYGAAAEVALNGAVPASAYKTGLGWLVHGTAWDCAGWYDLGCLGSGDRLSYLGACAPDALGKELTHLAQFLPPSLQLEPWLEWGQRWRDGLGGADRVGYVAGVHLIADAHGSVEGRDYYKREVKLNELSYNPATHITRDANGLLCWSDDAPAKLRDVCFDYFANRQEDALVAAQD